MKIAPPWATNIVDPLPISESNKMLIRLWIWCDRLLWISVTAGTAAALMAIFR